MRSRTTVRKRLHVEAGALGFRINITDVVGDCFFFLFETFDTFDEGLELILGETVSGLIVFGSGGSGVAIGYSWRCLA